MNLSAVLRLSLLLTVFGCARASAQAPALDLANRPAVEGITRTTLQNDAAKTVTRVRFDPGAAEPTHTHDYDIMIIPLEGGAAELTVGTVKKSYLYEGEVHVVPKGVPHQLANTSSTPFEIIAVALK